MVLSGMFRSLPISPSQSVKSSYTVVPCRLSVYTLSPWATPLRPSASTQNFDFPTCIAKAVLQDQEFYDAVEIPSKLPFSSPLTSLELDPLENDADAISFIDELPFSLEADSASDMTAVMQTSHVGRNTHQYERHKLYLQAAHQIKREKQKQQHTHGLCSVQPKSINKVIRPASPVPIDIDANDMKHMQYAWTGGKDKATYKKFSLYKIW